MTAANDPPNRPSTRVLVVEDHPLFREGLIQWLNRQEGLVCCGEADSAAVARQKARELQPDLVLLDLRLRGEDGLELIKQLVLESPGIRMLVLSQNDESIYAERALRAGALGYVMKEEATTEVLTAIRAVLKGDIHVSRTMAARLLKNYVGGIQPVELSGLTRLSDRELQVFQLIGAGCGNKQIAEKLKLSVKTIETYRENLKYKLNLPDANALSKAAESWVHDQKLPASKLPDSA